MELKHEESRKKDDSKIQAIIDVQLANQEQLKQIELKR